MTCGREEAEALSAMGFPGYAIGGVSVGEPEEEMLRQVGVTTPHLPEDKPRYTMGLGTPPQILKMIALGVDMFDCVMPTRLARNGTVFTPDGVINLRNERYRDLDRLWSRGSTITPVGISPWPTCGTWSWPSEILVRPC